MDPLVKKVVDTGISKGVDFSEISSAMYNSGAGENQVLQAQEYYNQIKKKSPSVAGVSPSISGRTPSSSGFGPFKVKGQGDPNDPSGLYGQVEEANRRINTANRIYDVLSKKGELSPKEIESARKDYQEYRSFYPNLPIDPSKDVGLLTDNIARDRMNIKAKSQPDESNYRKWMDYIYQSQPGGENGFLATILRGAEKVAGDFVSLGGAVISFGGLINDETDAFYSSVFGEETAENYKKAFKDTPLEPGAISQAGIGVAQFGKGMAEQWNENTKKIAGNWGMNEEQYEKGPGEALLEGDFSTAGKGIAIGMLHTMPEVISYLLFRFKAAGLAGEAITANLISKGTPKWIAGAAGRARAMAPTTLPLYTGANYAEVIDDPEFTTGEKLLYAVGSAVGSTLAESVGGFGEYFLGGAAKKQAVNQVKSSIMQSIGRGTVDMLKAAGVEGAEEVLDGGIQQALGIALGDRKFDANSLLDGFLIGAAMGGSTNLISKSPSLIGLSSDMLTTIKITDELSKIQAALSDPSLSDVERDLLTNRARVANNEIRRAKNSAAIFFQGYTPEDLQETMTLNSEIRRQIDSMPSFKTDEAKSAAIQSVKDSVARLKQIESKYDSQKKQQVQGAVQAGAQPGGVPVEGAGTAATAPGGVLQNVGQTQEEQVAQQRTEQASAFNVRPRLKKMKVTAKNAPGAYKMMMDALSNYTDEFLQQNKTDRASVERGIKSLFDVISSLDAKGRTVEIDVMGSIDEANKLFGFEINEVDGKFEVSSKIPGANRVFDTKEGADAYTKRVLYRGVNMMSDGGDVKISVLLPAMLDNTGYHEALHSLEVFDDKSADKLVVSLMNAIKKLPVLDGRMIAFMESYRGKPEPERNSEYLAELGSMISSGEISVEIRDSVIKSLTKSFLDFFKNMIGSDVDVTPTAEQLARTFNDIAEKLGRGEKQPPYRKTRKKGEESGAVDRAKVRFQGFDSWKGDNEYVYGSAVQDVKTGTPIVAKGYHGTTNDFYEFDASVKGNVEGYLGRVNYFTTDYQDAAINYQSEGPDLKSRIERRADEIESILNDDYIDDNDNVDIQSVISDYNLNEDDILKLEDIFNGDLSEVKPSEISYFLSEKELKGDEDRVLEVYIKLNNPLVLGGNPVYYNSYGSDTKEYADMYEMYAEEVADDNGVSIEEAKDEYDYEIRDRIMESPKFGNKILEAFTDALDKNAYGFMSDRYSEPLQNYLYDEEVNLNQLDRDLRSNNIFFENENGELAFSQVLSDFYKNLGFDGIILANPSNTFRGMGISPSTSHIHVFDEYANQIKLADGSNVTFGETRDIRFQGIESEISNLPTNEQKRAKELFQLIGENAELTQDVRDNLQVARYMEDDGKDVENIRMATGWERGRDGMWRYEIQDLEFKKKIGRFEEDLNQVIKSAKNGNLEQYDLNELIDSDLFYFYPSLNNTSVILSRRLVVGFQDVLGGAEGSYYKEGKRGIIAIKAKEDLTIEKLRLILVHEIQHAIQDIENFAKGNYGVSMQDEVAAEKEIKLLDNKIGVSTQIIRDGNDSFLSENINELSDSEKSAYKEILDYSKSASMPILDAAKVWDKIWKKDKDTQKNILKQNERYVKTAGEVESRNVEARIGMTPEQRREITLEKTEDVSRAEQIVFFDNSYGQAFQSIEASQPKFQRAASDEISMDDFAALSKRLNKFFKGNVKIVDADTFEKESEKFTGEKLDLKSYDGDVYGAVLPNGVMFINGLDVNSLLHEHTHLFNQVVMKVNPRLWSSIKEAVKKTAEWSQVKRNPLYSNLKTDDEVADEVFSKIVGNAAKNGWQKYTNQSIYQNIKALAQKFYNTILDLFGVDYYKGMSASGLADLTLTELMGGVSTLPYQIDAKINELMSKLLKGTKYLDQLRFNIDPNSRKKFEKALGEKDGRALYEIFGNVQDPSKLIDFAKSKFPIKGTLSSVAKRLVKDNNGDVIRNGNFGSIVIYKDYEKYLNEELKQVVDKATLDPQDLLNEVGYTLFNPRNLSDARNSFLHYYKKGHNICTLNPGSDRFSGSFVTFIVRNDADQTPSAEDLTQDNLTDEWRKYLEKKGRKNSDGTYNLNGLMPDALDPYSTSVISLQINKSNGSTKEISRYNHQIGSPDNIFSRDFDNLIEGLSDAMFKKFGVEKNTKQSTAQMPFGVIQDANGAYYNYIYETNGVYYGDGYYLENGVATLLDRGSERMVDGWVISNRGDGTATNIDRTTRGFLYGDVKKVNYIKGDEISLTTENGNFVFEVKNGAVVRLIEFPKKWRLDKFKELGIEVEYDENGNLILSRLGSIFAAMGSIDIQNMLWADDIVGISARADFNGTKIQSLGNLQYIKGNANFEDSQVQSLGELKYIGGGANFNNSQVHSLGKLKYISSYANFRDSQAQSLGELKYIGGGADFRDSQVQSLGELKYIGGGADFKNSQVQSLGKLKYIGGEAIFINSQIQSLDELRYIGSDADFYGSQVQSLGELKYIGGYANFHRIQVQSLGELKYVGGDADFGNSQVQSLGELKYIRGNAYFDGSQVQSLGELKYIGSRFVYSNSPIDSKIEDIKRKSEGSTAEILVRDADEFMTSMYREFEQFGKETEEEATESQPKFQALESEREVITLNDGKKITPTVIDGSTVFYHASSKKRIGRLRPNNAIQWGKAIYFSPSREDVVYEFGDENVTEVRLNLSNPVYTDTPDFSKVANRAIEIYTEEQIKKGADRESYSLDDIEDGYYFGEAAKQLGYDAIIDLNPNNYGGEIAVIDEGAVIYPEDIKSISPPKGKSDSILFQSIGERGAEGIQIEQERNAIEIDSKLMSLDYTLRRPRENTLVFVPINKLLQRHAKDNPSYDVTKKENQIGNRVQKAKEFLINYLSDNSFINPKTRERTRGTKVTYEPSVVGLYGGKLSFEDGRHRVLAAQEMGATVVAVEIPKTQVNTFKEELGVVDKKEWLKAPSNVGTFSEGSPSIMFQTPIDEAFDKSQALLDAMSKRGGIITNLVVRFADRSSSLKKKLIEANLKNARDLFVAQAGAGSRAKFFIDENFSPIYNGLNKENSEYLDKIIQLRRIIQIDEDFDSKGKPRIIHPSDKYGVPLNKERAEANLVDYESMLGSALYNDLINRSGLYFDAYKKLLSIMRDNGLITKELYDNLKSLLYQPRKFLDQFVSFEEGETTLDVKDLALNEAQIKTLQNGSDSEIMMNSKLLLAFSAKSVFSRVARNKTYTAISEAVKDPANDWISNKQLKNFKPVNYFVDGVREQFFIREDYQKQLYDSTRHLISPNVARVMRVLTGSAILKSFATQVNPLFALKNFPRDVLHVAMFTNIYGNNLYPALFRISRDAFRGMHDKMSNSKDFKEWLEYGGGMDFLSTEGFESRSVRVGAFNKIRDAMSTFGEYSEVGVRLAVYKKTKADLTDEFVKTNGRGPNKEESDTIKTQAAVASREIIDFAQGGSWAKAGENIIPYLNASIQGFRVGANYIVKNPKDFAVKFAQLSLAVGVIMFYNSMMADDDEWEKIQDGEKMRNFIIFTPFKDKDGNRYYIKIAKTQQAIAWITFAEMMSAKMLNETLNPDDDEKIADKYKIYGDRTYDALVDGLMTFFPKNPLDLKKEITSAIPAINALAAVNNYDTFINKQVSYDYQKVPAVYEDILDPDIPYFYKALSQSIHPVMEIGPKRLGTAVEKITTGAETSVIVAGAYYLLDNVARKVANLKTDELNLGEVPKGDSELNAISSMFSPLKGVVKKVNPNLKKYQYSEDLDDIALRGASSIKTIKNASRNLGEKYYDALRGQGDLTKDEVLKEVKDYRDMLIEKGVHKSQVESFVNAFKMSAKSSPRESWDAGYYDIMYSPSSDATVEIISKLKGDNLTDAELKEYFINYKKSTGYNIKNMGEVYSLYRKSRDKK